MLLRQAYYGENLWHRHIEYVNTIWSPLPYRCKSSRSDKRGCRFRKGGNAAHVDLAQNKGVLAGCIPGPEQKITIPQYRQEPETWAPIGCCPVSHSSVSPGRLDIEWPRVLWFRYAWYFLLQLCSKDLAVLYLPLISHKLIIRTYLVNENMLVACQVEKDVEL